MTITMSSASVPLFRHYLRSLSDLLDKAEAYALTRNIQATTILGARLYPDMYPLLAQVQFACDFAKGAVARLVGIENPGFADAESDFTQLHARIDRTLAFITSVDAEQIDGAEERAISLKFGKLDLSASGHDYLIGFAVPSFIFHVSIAYAILRNNGVEIGKLDFLGTVPGMAGFAVMQKG